MGSQKDTLSVGGLILQGPQNPDALALEAPGYLPMTYRELRDQVAYAVRLLNAQGFGPGDRIALIAPGGPEAASATLAIMAGFTLVPLNSQCREADIARFITLLGIKAMIISDGLGTGAGTAAGRLGIPLFTLVASRDKAGVFALSPSVPETGSPPRYAGPSDIAALLQTSGTTSQPKIVPMTQKRMMIGMIHLNTPMALTGRDKNLHILPFDTGYGIGFPLLSPLIAGGSVICPREFIAEDFPSLVRTFSPTHYSGAPAHHKAILGVLRQLPEGSPVPRSIRFISTGAAALNPDDAREMEERLGARMYDSYIMAEAFISTNVNGKPGSVGIPFVEFLEIRNDADRPVPAGVTGEIVVRGKEVFEGYLDAPEENAASFTDGWFRTGDLGYLDHEGNLFLAGRKKEAINKGGRKISPARIDEALLLHPGVLDAMAFRVPDPLLGDEVAAMIVRRDAALTGDALRRFCLDHLLPFMTPKYFYFTERIPRNALGKPVRDEGTRTYGEAAGAAQPPVLPGMPGGNVLPSAEGIKKTLRALWADILEMPSVAPDDDFFLCGGNSLSAIELLIRIQREFTLSLPPDTIYRYPTFRNQLNLLMMSADHEKKYHPLIVPLREGGDRAPVFCIHPLGGWMDHYLKILPAIDRSRPVYGIRGRGLAPGEILPKTVEETAREEIDAIRTVQKTGPWNLIGFSNGGVIAYELACQLRDQGEEVSFLGIIDVSAPATEVRYFKTLAAKVFPGPVLGRIPAFFERHLKEHPDNPAYRVIVKAIRAMVHGVFFRSGAKSLPESEAGLHHSVHKREGALDHFPAGNRHNMQAQLDASRMYIPHRFPGDLVLFSTGDDPIIFPGDSTRGWGSVVTGRCTVVPVPGNHSNLFREPQLEVLNEKIRQTLRALP